jgi:predicted RNase H-like nuclease
MMEVVWLPECQQWAFEVHPEVCFWAMNGEHPMAHNKKTEAGVNDSSAFFMRRQFPRPDAHWNWIP